jgi:hypothetical protein
MTLTPSPPYTVVQFVTQCRIGRSAEHDRLGGQTIRMKLAE